MSGATRPAADDAARRAFWTARNEAAYRFMFDAVLPYPVTECGEPPVSLPEAAAAAGVRVGFADAPHVGGRPRMFYLRAGQIPSFVAAARAFNDRGWMIRVEDGYRSRAIQAGLARLPLIFDAILARTIWELGGQVPDETLMFRRASGLVATVPKFATHMSASAIDLSVVQLDDPAREVDRGAPYVELSELTPMDSPFIDPVARRHRDTINALMRQHGFVAYPFEFWHYSSGDAYGRILGSGSGPAIYGPIDWDPTTGRMAPAERPLEPLISPAEVRAEIALALERLAHPS